MVCRILTNNHNFCCWIAARGIQKHLHNEVTHRNSTPPSRPHHMAHMNYALLKQLRFNCFLAVFKWAPDGAAPKKNGLLFRTTCIRSPQALICHIQPPGYYALFGKFPRFERTAELRECAGKVFQCLPGLSSPLALGFPDGPAAS